MKKGCEGRESHLFTFKGLDFPDSLKLVHRQRKQQEKAELNSKKPGKKEKLQGVFARV